MKKEKRFFSKPPIELVAEIVKKLDTKDATSLAKTSKANKYIVKEHHPEHKGYKIAKELTKELP